MPARTFCVRRLAMTILASVPRLAAVAHLKQGHLTRHGEERSHPLYKFYAHYYSSTRLLLRSLALKEYFALCASMDDTIVTR